MSPAFRSHSSSFPRRSAGFALLVTIVLVSFLVLILIGLATFSRVETQVSDNAQELAKARQSALTGMNIALGQLQRQAGPDGRVTARSEITNGSAGLPDNQPYITGVWNSSTGSVSATPDAWLVSGTEAGAANNILGIQDPSAAVTTPYDDAAAWVFLVYDNAVGSGTLTERKRRIRLTKQDIAANKSDVPGFSSASTGTIPVGHYAYWVADEGLKASINAVAPNLTSLSYDNSSGAVPWGDNWSSANTDASKLRDRLSQFSQPYQRIDQFYSGINYTLAATVPELRKVNSLDQFRFVTNSDTAATQLTNFHANFHEMTPLARGVLSRTDAGNLATTPRLRSDISSSIAASSGTSTAINDYWIQRPSSTTGQFSATYGIKGRKAAATNSNLNFSIAPVLSEAGIFFDFGQDATGNLILRFALLAEFWNPYAATLTTAAGATLRVRVSTSAPLQYTAQDSTTVPVTHTITVAAGDIAIAQVPANQTFGPGGVLQLQTTSAGVFAATGGPCDTAFSSGAVATMPLTTASLPAVGAGVLTVVLEENTSGGTWNTLQTFQLPARNAETVTPAPTYAFGYGYELSRNLDLWSDPATGNARDPRAATFVTANHFQPLGSTEHWNADASNNTNPSGLAGDAPFIPSGTNPAVILFDLPRQEITSLAQLLHMPGDLPYEISRGIAATQANDKTIWDNSYVSTVPMAHNWDYLTEARPNRYLEVFAPSQAPAGEFDSAANRLTSLRTSAKSARYQLIRGAFNINSTSAAAWSAVLGATLTNWDTEDDIATDISGAFFRVPHGAQEKGLANLVPSASLNDGTALTAVGRRLSGAEINALSNAIVAELKSRGKPFSSLGEFASSTVLSAAITAANLNDTAIATASYRHAAGAVTSGDVLAAIAPFMAARSDTFKIRTYGDTVNPVTGDVTGRVWCEAIVQRIPDLADAPAAAVGDVVDADPTAYPFGRKFQVVSFRWLNSSDL